MRWSLALAQFDIEFQFKAGKMNVPADTLSRPGSRAFDQLGCVNRAFLLCSFVYNMYILFCLYCYFITSDI